MKLQRWEPDFDVRFSKADYDEGNQYWCKAEDLAQLEVSHAELLEAAKAVVERWDSPRWKEQEHTGVFIHRLRDAIAKAEGEQP